MTGIYTQEPWGEVEGYPAVYANVYKYLDWIYDKTGTDLGEFVSNSVKFLTIGQILENVPIVAPEQDFNEVDQETEQANQSQSVSTGGSFGGKMLIKFH